MATARCDTALFRVSVSICLILSFMSVSSNASDPIVDTDREVYLQKGTRGVLPCRVTVGVALVYWHKGPTFSTSNRVIIMDPKTAAKDGAGFHSGSYDVNGNFSLIINNVDIHDSDNFYCEISKLGTEFNFHNSTNVVVFGVSPVISRQAASSFLGSSSTPRHRRQRRRARTGRIVTECSDNNCDRTILESYFMPQPEKETSPNNVFESDSVETNLERSSSNSNSPDVTKSTGVEAPQPYTNITATSPPDVQPENENTLSEVEVINCPPMGKMGRKSKSTELLKKMRTSTGLSREELKHCRSLVRKASRDLKKQQSREKRRWAKEQRRQDKTKQKRLESAERSRETDRVGLNGDAAMEEMVPRANDVRKPKSHPPNDVFESDSVDTNVERPSSNSNTPDATKSTGVEAPQPHTNITATSAPDVQPENENTLSEVEVINCPPMGKMGRKSKSTESSSKKMRTSTGLSREELKHCKTLIRKASRELKKQQSREKRRRAKEQRRQDKTKQKRLALAELTRGTDNAETVPRANDVDDPTQPRRPGRKPHPRGSSRERKAHLAAAEAAEAARAAAAHGDTQTPHILPE